MARNEDLNTERKRDEEGRFTSEGSQPSGARNEAGRSGAQGSQQGSGQRIGSQNKDLDSEHKRTNR